MLLLLHDLIPTLLTLIRIHHNEIVVDLLNVLGILSKTILLIIHLVLLLYSLRPLVLLLTRIHLLKLLLIVEILLRLLLLLLLHLLSIQVHLLLHLLHLVILLLVTHLVHLLVLIPMEVLSLIVVAHFFLLILLVASVLVIISPGAVVKELVLRLQILGDIETRRRKHVFLASVLAFICRTVRLIASIKQLVRFLHVASSFPTLLYLLEQTRNRLIQQLTLGVYKFTSGSAIIISIMKFPIVF